MTLSFKSAALLAVILVAGIAQAKDKDYTITLKGDQFTPQNLVVPAGQKIKITVKNATDKAAEFESDDLDREKVVAAKSEVVLDVGPLKADTYSYVNDFHEESKGTITAK